MILNTYILSMNDIVNKGMIKAVRKRDIIKARVLSLKEKRELENGAPDIEAITPSGQKLMITRKRLISDYTYLSGRKISLAGWKSNKYYTVMRFDNTNCLVMMVPSNCTTELNGVKANKSGRKMPDYIVALEDASGGIDSSSLGIIPSAMFHKMFYIPQQEIIIKHRNSGHKLFGTTKSSKENRARTVTPDSSLSTMRRQPKNILNNEGRNQVIKNNMQENINREAAIQRMQAERAARIKEQQYQQRVAQQEQPKYKYRAVARLVDISGNLKGLRIQSISGEMKELTLRQVAELCRKKQVMNVMLSHNPATGKSFLRGNGIRIEDLPADFI